MSSSASEGFVETALSPIPREKQPSHKPFLTDAKKHWFSVGTQEPRNYLLSISLAIAKVIQTAKETAFPSMRVSVDVFMESIVKQFESLLSQYTDEDIRGHYLLMASSLNLFRDLYQLRPKHSSASEMGVYTKQGLSHLGRSTALDDEKQYFLAVCLLYLAIQNRIEKGRSIGNNSDFRYFYESNYPKRDSSDYGLTFLEIADMAAEFYALRSKKPAQESGPKAGELTPCWPSPISYRYNDESESRLAPPPAPPSPIIPKQLFDDSSMITVALDSTSQSPLPLMPGGYTSPIVHQKKSGKGWSRKKIMAGLLGAAAVIGGIVSIALTTTGVFSPLGFFCGLISAKLAATASASYAAYLAGNALIGAALTSVAAVPAAIPASKAIHRRSAKKPYPQTPASIPFLPPPPFLSPEKNPELAKLEKASTIVCTRKEELDGELKKLNRADGKEGALKKGKKQQLERLSDQLYQLREERIRPGKMAANQEPLSLSSVVRPYLENQDMKKCLHLGFFGTSRTEKALREVIRLDGPPSPEYPRLNGLGYQRSL